MRTEIVACVDGSAYAGSVCDHAAWLCGQMDRAAITVLHAAESHGERRQAERLLSAARARLRDQGAAGVRARRADGPLCAALARETGGLLVLGKRGERSADSRRDLGSNAAAVLRTFVQPLCLVSRLYLPVNRALVLIDADPVHARTIETVAANPALCELELDIVMMQPPGADGASKLAWARAALGRGQADVYSMDQATPEGVAARYMAEHGTDLIVFSREMMFAPERRAAPEDNAVWSWRAPVFVC